MGTSGEAIKSPFWQGGIAKYFHVKKETQNCFNLILVYIPLGVQGV